MGKQITLVALLLAQIATAEPKKDTIILYQVGQNGNYCVSITPDASGCVSGTDDQGNRYNTLDITQGKQVVFRNVSDAPHDMVITGANKENLPAQGPNGADAQKQMAQVDMNKEKITCSFHGDQLAVGYRVPNKQAVGELGEGHKESPDAVRNQDPNAMIATADDGGGQKKITKTQLADVSNEVLKKGRPEDVERLVAARPMLMDKLQEVRPLLAQDIAKSGALALKGPSKVGSAMGAFPGDGSAPAAGGAAVAAAKVSGAKGAGFGASGGTGGGAETVAAANFGSGVKVRDLSSLGDDLDARLLTQGEEMEEDEEGDEEETGAEARVASLGLGTPDRTKMKVVGGMPGVKKSMDRDSLFSSSMTPWIIGLLALLVMMAMRFVIFGTRSKKEEKGKKVA